MAKQRFDRCAAEEQRCERSPQNTSATGDALQKSHEIAWPQPKLTYMAACAGRAEP
jgi:hypothetical protein